MHLGRALAAVMRAMGWTQVRLSEASGVPQGRISAISRNYRGERPTHDEILAIETALGLPPGYVYGVVGLATAEGVKRGAAAAAKLDL